MAYVNIYEAYFPVVVYLNAIVQAIGLQPSRPSWLTQRNKGNYP